MKGLTINLNFKYPPFIFGLFGKEYDPKDIILLEIGFVIPNKLSTTTR